SAKRPAQIVCEKSGWFSRRRPASDARRVQRTCQPSFDSARERDSSRPRIRLRCGGKTRPVDRLVVGLRKNGIRRPRARTLTESAARLLGGTAETAGCRRGEGAAVLLAGKRGRHQQAKARFREACWRGVPCRGYAILSGARELSRRYGRKG